MRQFLKGFSYVLHPIFMPLLGSVIYFLVTPKFVPESFLYAKLFALTILTVIVPILTYFLLQSLKLVSSVELVDIRERRLPLLMQIAFTVIIVQLIINGYEFPELNAFFLGVLASAAIAFILALLHFKVSLHMIGVSGVLFFVIGLSMHYSTNFLLLIAVLAFAAGGVASSRLQARAHSFTEILTGVVVGGLPQLVVFYFWL